MNKQIKGVFEDIRGEIEKEIERVSEINYRGHATKKRCARE